MSMNTAASAPPMTVAGMNFFGYPVADWVQCAAFCWIAVQFGWWAYKTFIRRDKE